jgi:putative two-component system response regulator
MFLEEGRGTHFDPACVDAFMAGWDQVIEVRRNFQDQSVPQL